MVASRPRLWTWIGMLLLMSTIGCSHPPGIAEAAASTSSPEVSPTTVGGPGTTQLAGVPFGVCRPTSIPGRFANADDTAWTFAAERQVGSGCAGKPGQQFVGTGMVDRVDAYSGGTTPKMGIENWWAPYATPDLDGDGIDEIAVATTGFVGVPSPPQGWSIQLYLYRQDGTSVVPIWLDCPGCSPPVGWNLALGFGQEESGDTIVTGFYCGVLPGRPDLGDAIVIWQGFPREPDRLLMDRSTLRDGTFVSDGTITIHVDGRAAWPPTGEDSMCGSHTRQPVG